MAFLQGLFQIRGVLLEQTAFPLAGWSIVGVVWSIEGAPITKTNNWQRRLAVGEGIFCVFVHGELVVSEVRGARCSGNFEARGARVGAQRRGCWP